MQIVCRQLILGQDKSAEGEATSLFVVFGATATGKSHLLDGLVREWQAINPQRKCLTLSAADFARSFGDAYQRDQLVAWRARLRQVHMLAIDDLEQIDGKHAAQRELMSLIEDFQASDRVCLFTSRKNPQSNGDLLSGLSSRLSGGLVVHLQAAGLNCRQAILHYFAEQQDCHITPMASHAMAKASTNIPKLTRLLTHCRLVSKNQVIDTRIVQLARNSVTKKKLSLADICRSTARYFQVPAKQLRGRSRRRGTALARNVAVYLSRELTSHTLKEIGQYFGNRDHTTVMHSCRKIAADSKSETSLSSTIEDLKSHLTRESQW